MCRLIYFGAIKNKDIEAVKEYVRCGVDINAKDKSGNTALMIASENGCLEIVKYLVENGADINAKDNECRTALMEASRYGHLEVVKYLVESGADINTKNKDGKSILIIALEKENVELVKYFVENGASDIYNALVAASEYGKLGVVKCLVEHGVDINSKVGEIALICAVENGRLRIVAYFIENGIDINAKYYYRYYKGVTILMIASVNGYLEIVKYLIKKGADISIESDGGITALEYMEYGKGKNEYRYQYGKIREILSKEWLNKNYPNEEESNDNMM